MKVFCQKTSVKPLPAVQAYLQEDCLRFSVDSIELKHWSPILNSIAENRSISKVYIYSRCGHSKIRERINTEEKLERIWRCRAKGRTRPILYTNFLLLCLVDSVAVFARDSTTLSSITLDGIPLALKYLNILCSGLKNNQNLMYLSLAKCRIGDVGCDFLLGCLRNCPKLRMLNLSSCRLTNRSGRYLSLFLKGRKADLLQNVWEESSLQSQEESLQKEGLHTLILNKNPKIEDIGLRQLMHALKNDFWLKSMSLRGCGITRQGGQMIFELLQSNRVIITMDLAENSVPIGILQSILRTLKRRREAAGSMLVKKKYLLDWRNRSSRNLFRRHRGLLSLSSRHSTKPSTKVSKRILQKKRYKRRICRLKKKGKEEKILKRQNCDKKRLCDLEAQLSSIVHCNSILKEEISNNRELVRIEEQERSRAEDELQKLSARLNNLKSKVIAFDQFHSKLCGEEQLVKDIRHVCERMESFWAKRHYDYEEDTKIEDTVEGVEVNLNDL